MLLDKIAIDNEFVYAWDMYVAAVMQLCIHIYLEF